MTNTELDSIEQAFIRHSLAGRHINAANCFDHVIAEVRRLQGLLDAIDAAEKS